MTLKEQLDNVQMSLLAEKANGQSKNQDRIDELEKQEGVLLQQIMEEGNQNLQARVEQAKETGYILDTLDSNGIPLIELSHTPENHELIAIAVQKAFLSQQDAFNVKLNELQWRNDSQTKLIENGTADNQRLIHENGTLRDHLAQTNLEKEDALQKLANATNIIAEKDDEIKRLQEQLTAQAVPVTPLSAEEQETKLVTELMGNRLKVTNIRYKDESGLDRKKVIANNALTGEQIEEYAIYTKTRWEEISLEEAAQLKADYANKKAELEAQNAIPELAVEELEPVKEQEAPAEEKPFQESGHELGEGRELEGQLDGNGVHAENEMGEVITLESLKAELDALKETHGARLDNIERIANIPAVA